MADLWIPIVLMILGFIAILVEFFVPAGGILGAGGIGMVIASIVWSFSRYGVVTGSIFLMIGLIGVPVMLALSFKIFPRTYFGKKLILRNSQKREDGFVAHSLENSEELLGKEGVALTILRPIGMALIEGRKLNVLTSGEYVEKDSKIKVIKVTGNKIIVVKL